jgi:hypothetical protein
LRSSNFLNSPSAFLIDISCLRALASPFSFGFGGKVLSKPNQMTTVNPQKRATQGSIQDSGNREEAKAAKAAIE